MKEKLLALLIAKFAGVSESILERIATKKAGSISDETQLQSIVDGIDYGLILQSEVDSRITEANKTAITNYEKKHGLKEGKIIQQPDPKEGQDPKLPEDAPPWAQALLKQNQELVSKISQFENGGKKNELLVKLKEKIKGKVPESYLKGRNIEIAEESQIDTIAQQIEADFVEFKQDAINQGVVLDVPKGNQPAGSKAVVEEIKDLAKTF